MAFADVWFKAAVLLLFILCICVLMLPLFHGFYVVVTYRGYTHLIGCFLLPWRIQNAEKSTHIKGRLLYQAMILYNYVPFQNENFS